MFDPIWSKADTFQHCPELFWVRDPHFRIPSLGSGDSALFSSPQVYFAATCFLNQPLSLCLLVCLSLFLSCFLKFVFGSHKSSLWKYLCTWHISKECLDFNKAIFVGFFSIFLSRGRSLSLFFFFNGFPP